MMTSRCTVRACATCAAKERKPFVLPKVKKTVCVSTSNDIFRNLALEHWFYKNLKFDEHHHKLMLWVNGPCVVIGRHQNPWTECNVPWLAANKTHLARRNSGGGTVYHDGGNLNLTFFTPNEHYHRRSNLQFISDTIYQDFGLRMDINKREDLAVRGYKVSGTAAKLARHCAYHHCTLLVAADKQNLRSALQPSDWNITTNATQSIKSNIRNLRDECADITVDGLVHSLARGYLNWNNTNANSDQITDSLQTVAPSETHFPGLETFYNEYKSWQWTFGKTPKFSASKTFKHHEVSFELAIQVEEGLISDVDVKVPNGYPDYQIVRQLQDTQAIVGQKYDVELISRLGKVFQETLQVSSQHLDSAVV
ncbi:lipoyl amidotransferase LIPT1, mitochondrial-like [Atheta coriaria]|uniref:lipoyl amidotransferase LIPT1, mitochondrial-like n=1 Tax=Dalotia coriaria TaxID=877792 RepID=UPI0031F35CEC